MVGGGAGTDHTLVMTQPAGSHGPRDVGPVGSEADLEEILTRPAASLVEAIRRYRSPLVILGAGGKMGPTLAVLARRAAEAAGHSLEVIAVSRFTDPAIPGWLNERGVRTDTCDLFDPVGLGRLPDTPNLVYLVGLKFGTSRDPATTWAANTLIPAAVCARFRGARIVALSTGNVYPWANTSGGGWVESDPLTPVGEYANAAVARERIFEFESRRTRTPVTLLRLSYAVELRYGVLVDLAWRIQRGEPIELVNGAFNCIWQGDANDAILRALEFADVPPTIWNLCRPETFEVRATALELGRLLGRAPCFSGAESGTALLSNSAALWARLGRPATSLETMLQWIAGWVRQGGRNLGKPTHFETRDGRY